VKRLQRAFDRARSEKRAGFIAYITCGDPTLDRSRELVHEFDRSGVDVVELGVPFSDPMADGGANQEAALRALKNKVTLRDVLDTARTIRDDGCEMPIVLFTYCNPVHAMGYEKFAERCAESGVDGVLMVDLPPEEAGEYREYMDRAGLDTIFLVAPTTGDDRLPTILDVCSGFVYYASRVGVTGEKNDLDAGISGNVSRIRGLTDLPVAVGFGVSTPEQVGSVADLADGVIVGSAIVRRIGEGGDTDDMVKSTSDFVKTLVSALHSA
jgi:tryptophan synthase alpha chain